LGKDELGVVDSTLNDGTAGVAALTTGLAAGDFADADADALAAELPVGAGFCAG
jgi:hypothetical protein